MNLDTIPEDNELNTNSPELDITNEDNYVNLLNVYLTYYKTLFNKNKSESLLDDINHDKINSTNRGIEFLYGEMAKMKEDNDKDIIYKPGELKLEECEELYVLLIDNKQVYTCQLLLPLISYVSTLDWININWSIDPLKTIY